MKTINEKVYIKKSNKWELVSDYTTDIKKRSDYNELFNTILSKVHNYRLYGKSDSGIQRIVQTKKDNTRTTTIYYKSSKIVYRETLT